MATIEDRPFSKNYSGLINQSVIAAGLFVICTASHEYMKRKRRGRYTEGELGSVESWQFGYLFQARSWARNPVAPIAQGRVLSWVAQVLRIPDHEMNTLRGVDATLYVRILHGCVWFTLAQTLTTLPILLPIHVTFADKDVSPKSMTRASISSLVTTSRGAELLWIHLLLLIWVTGSWIYTLRWIMRGAFRFRAQKIRETAKRVEEEQGGGVREHYEHPHPQFPFHAQRLLPSDFDPANRGLRARTVMVTNIPGSLRSEKELKDYFEYWLSRPLAVPSMGVTSAAQPGFFDRMLAFVYNRATRVAARLFRSSSDDNISAGLKSPTFDNSDTVPQGPLIEKVAVVRKMTELASLLERREEVLKNLETAHIKLACNALEAVAEHLQPMSTTDKIKEAVTNAITSSAPSSPIESSHGERPQSTADPEEEAEDRMQLLIRTLKPFLPSSTPTQRPVLLRAMTMNKARGLLARRGAPSSPHSLTGGHHPSPSPSPLRSADRPHATVWDALLSLPRSVLDEYQPLIHLSALFRGRTVPSIDYYTAKLNVLTGLITEQRALPLSSFPAVSTAFVTFARPEDARRACKYLAVHPSNPVNVCLVTMAPEYEDLDWTRLMKSAFRGEFVKDWVVNIGVWALTIFWVFPVTSIVAFVSIQTISAYWPGLKHYLDKHEWQSEVLQSLVPTLLVALLALLVPLILLLIVRKAHTISMLSVMHDRILTRYYKFLIVNVLVFFCVGTVTLQTILTFHATSGTALIQAVSESFPTAAPFYVGWLIFTVAMHGCLEVALFGLPLIVYPSTQRQVTPRKREVGIRPRTFNYYYWLPTHLLVIHIILLFAVLNPLIIPFGFVYFCVEAVVIKNQLLHVYAKNYEGNGQNILIRLTRYSLDGLILAQAVFLAYMVVVKKKANVGVTAVLIILTAFTKLLMTRHCRARFEKDDLLEAKILSGAPVDIRLITPTPAADDELADPSHSHSSFHGISFFNWHFTSRIGLSYGTMAHRNRDTRRPMNPFRRPRSSGDSGMPLQATTSTSGLLGSKDHLHLSAEAAVPMLPGQLIVEEPQEMDMPDGKSPGSSLGLVVPHPPHPIWDDESNPNMPYDNPYYTRQISEALWLPRDPMSLLNLDDTVEMRASLTSEAGAGRLGAWAEEEFITSAISSSFARSFTSLGEVDEEVAFPLPTPMTLDGTETIDLPPAIASRVEHIEKEHGVETARTRKPSILPRRKSTLSGPRTSPLRRRTMESMVPPMPGIRTVSLGAAASATELPVSASHLTVAEHRRQRSASVDVAGIRRPPPIRSLTSMPGSFLTVPPNSAAPSSIISTREAVVGEAIAEEQEAAQERQRQEQKQQERAKEPRSWLTSWMYSVLHDQQ